MNKLEQLRTIEYDRKICNSGFAAILRGRLVDIRKEPMAELLTEFAIQEILFNLEGSENKLNLETD